MDNMDDEYGAKLDEMQDAVDAAIADRLETAKEKFVDVLKRGERPDAVIYSAYANQIDEPCLPINNLHEVPFKGTFTVIGEYDSFWDGRGVGIIGEPMTQQCGKEFRSEPITDPTWLQLAVLANESILTTNDFHHIFLESVNLVGDSLYLVFGS